MLETIKDYINAFYALSSEDTSVYYPNDMCLPKAQKLLYYAQGWFLAKYDQPLFDEDFLAWENGPVLKSLHFQIQRGDGSRVNEGNSRALLNILNTFATPCKLKVAVLGSFSFFHADNDRVCRVYKHLKEVYNTYYEYSARGLIDMSKKEPPYIETRRSGDTFGIISKSLIRDYFRSLEE
jgi:uncharacterized phage-associated protein